MAAPTARRSLICVPARSLVGRPDIGTHPWPGCSENRLCRTAEFTVGFRDKHSSDWTRLVGLLLERKSQFTEPSLDPVVLDIRKVLTIHAQCALLGDSDTANRNWSRSASNTFAASLAGNGNPAFMTGVHCSRPSALTCLSTLMSISASRTFTLPPAPES